MNNKQKITIKKRIIYGLVSGLVYALVKSTLDYYNEKAFSLISLIAEAVIFGIIMALIMHYKEKKK